MSEYIEFAVRMPKDEADSFIARFGKENVRILGYLLGEEIVRCRDCAYSVDEGYGCRRFAHMDLAGDYRWKEIPAEIEPDGFCAWGEKKVDE